MKGVTLHKACTYPLLVAKSDVLVRQWLLLSVQLESDLLELHQKTADQFVDSLVLIADDEVSFVVPLDTDIDSSCSSFFEHLHISQLIKLIIDRLCRLFQA